MLGFVTYSIGLKKSHLISPVDILSQTGRKSFSDTTKPNGYAFVIGF
jgi:hypothetical protein